ncbi:MAG TPA: response regulator [Candidatus Acidoferrales bacterium]|nr:response regulator [Candidatus Acidoferrales bacterium]
MPERLRVLIVEDSEQDYLLCVRELKKAGFSVEHLRVGTLGLLQKALAPHSWDVILSDYNLPGFTGLDAFCLARARGVQVPFIIVSGGMTEEQAREARACGISDCIDKQNLDRLVSAVQRELARGARQRKSD